VAAYIPAWICAAAVLIGSGLAQQPTDARQHAKLVLGALVSRTAPVSGA